MLESFKCPSCSAPLEFTGSTMQKCEFCGSSIVVPSSVFERSQNFPFDISALTGKALAIKEIYDDIRDGRKIEAIKKFRETFGTGLKEAKDAVEALERGESIDLSGASIATKRVTVDLDGVSKTTAKFGNAIVKGMLVVLVCSLFVAGAVLFFAYRQVTRSAGIGQAIDQALGKKNSGSESQLAKEILRFGGDGVGAGKFKDNRYIAVDGAGKIYSGDFFDGRVQIFDASGKFLYQIKIPDLRNIAVSRGGILYASDNRVIQAYESDSGKLLATVKASWVNGIAVTIDGDVVIANRKALEVYNADLKIKRTLANAADEASARSGFEMLAVDGAGQIYAVDSQNGDICKFSSEGKFLTRFSSGSRSPNGIAVDSKQRIFVGNVSNIFILDSNGAVLGSFETKQAFGLVFNENDELFAACRPFVVKYTVK